MNWQKLQMYAPRRKKQRRKFKSLSQVNSQTLAEYESRLKAGEPIPAWIKGLVKSKTSRSQKLYLSKTLNKRERLMNARVDDLRRKPTTAEVRLYARLTQGQTGLKFQKGIMLHGGRFFIIDIFHKNAALAIEVDGSYHATPEQRSYDKYRDQRLAAKGIKTIRFTNEQVNIALDSVVDVIREEIFMRLRGIRLQKATSPRMNMPEPMQAMDKNEATRVAFVN